MYNSKVLKPGDCIFIENAGDGARGADGCIAKVMDPSISINAEGLAIYDDFYLVLIQRKSNVKKIFPAKVGDLWRVSKSGKYTIVNEEEQEYIKPFPLPDKCTTI
jgi:hypothetical protein